MQHFVWTSKYLPRLLFQILRHYSELKSNLSRVALTLEAKHHNKKKVSIVNDFLSFEVGGRDKSFEQIADLPHSYILADGIEHPIGKKLPLWIVGLLY